MTWTGTGWRGISSRFPCGQLGDALAGQRLDHTYWMFQYRSVGSVNGFNEFVENQTCHAIPLSVPAEAGIFNQFEYATGGLRTGAARLLTRADAGRTV